MVKDISGSTQHSLDRECSIVYDYLHHRAATQSALEVIQEFQHLFQQGKNQNIQVSQALSKIALVPEQFDRFLSNCFYSVLNCWLDDPESIFQIPKLFDTLDLISTKKSLDRRRQQLFRLIENYHQSNSYLQLKAIIAIVEPQTTSEYNLKSALSTDGIGNSNRIEVNSCLVRYPYLYQYFLPKSERFERLSRFVEQLQTNRQKDFEFSLSKHIIYRFRLKQLAKMKLLGKGAGKMITKADNPSLLSEKALKVALQQYVGKIDREKTALEQAQSFIAENDLRNSYGVFKQDLHHFLSSNIQPRNSSYQFKHLLQQKLTEIFPQSDAKPLNRTLILQTCRQLFSFFIVDLSLPTDSDRFRELIANLGTAQAMLILVKLTLICPESKSDLEQKICSIATHYQLDSVQTTPWLIKSLEHLSIAFSIYFGKMDVSLVRNAR